MNIGDTVAVYLAPLVPAGGDGVGWQAVIRKVGPERFLVAARVDLLDTPRAMPFEATLDEDAAGSVYGSELLLHAARALERARLAAEGVGP